MEQNPQPGRAEAKLGGKVGRSKASEDAMCWLQASARMFPIPLFLDKEERLCAEGVRVCAVNEEVALWR